MDDGRKRNIGNRRNLILRKIQIMELWDLYDKDGNKTLVNADCKELRIDLNFYMADKPHFEE